MPNRTAVQTKHMDLIIGYKVKKHPKHKAMKTSKTVIIATFKK